MLKAVRLRGWLLVALLAGSCHRDPPPPPPEVDPKAITWPAPPVDAPSPVYRTDPPQNPIVPELTGTGKTFMVTSESTDASKVGRDILAAGGNAVDGAVATAFALAVTHPSAGNIAGGGFAIVRTGPGKATAIDFRETAPAKATETMYLDKDGKPMETSRVSGLASGVPGSVAGLYELHKKYGKKPWKDVVAPAIRLAKDGFTLDEYTAHQLAEAAQRKKLSTSPGSVAIWFENGEPKKAGTTIKIPDLAATLERIRDRGADGFYKGETAKLIVDEMAASKGIISAEDLANYKVVWRDPLRFAYRGKSIVSMPPPSSGGIVLAMTAGMFKDVDLGKVLWHGPDHLHRLAEVWRRAFSVRNEILGDPAYVKNIPIAKLMSQDYLDKLAGTISGSATPSKQVPKLIEGLHTTHLCVVDGSGLAVSMTTTINDTLGSGLTVRGAGFLMNNEMDDFAVKPGAAANMYGLVQGAANKIEPGKRMLSSMSPTIVEDEKGDVFMLVGAGGGPRIITATWQVLSNVIDQGEHIDLAMAQPRIHHQDLPDVMVVEPASIDANTDESLRAMGHALDFSRPKFAFGHATAIVRAADHWEGSVDPRAGGAAIGDN